MSDKKEISRRAVIGTGAAAACALPLAACGVSSSSSSMSPSSAPSSAPPATPASSGAAASGTDGLVAVAKVPVGSSVPAKAPDGKPIVVSQPKAGEVVAFSAVCTHMGCTVAPAGKELHCPCHGSVFDAATGKVLHGPAARPLPKVAVKVSGGEVVPG